MIHGITGLPGNGKSQELLRRIRLAQVSGRLVGTNFRCEGAEYLPNFEDWIYFASQAQDAVLAVDEAEVSLGAREWHAIPKHTRNLFMQHRHLGIDLWWASQRWDGVDKSLRGLTQWQHDCEKVFPGFPQNPLPDGGYYLVPIFRVTTWAGEKKATKKPYRRAYRFFDSAVAAMVDVSEFLTEDKSSREKLDEALALMRQKRATKARNIR